LFPDTGVSGEHVRCSAHRRRQDVQTQRIEPRRANHCCVPRDRNVSSEEISRGSVIRFEDRLLGPAIVLTDEFGFVRPLRSLIAAQPEIRKTTPAIASQLARNNKPRPERWA
jgi:hypothetical protein